MSNNIPIESLIRTPDSNLLVNAQRNAQEKGTGLTNLWANRGNPEMYQAAGQYLTNTAPSQMLRDTANAMLSPYETSLQQIATTAPSETLRTMARGAYNNPIDATLDLISLGGLKGLGKAADVVNTKTGTRLLPSAAGKDLESAVNVANAKVVQDVTDMHKTIKEITPENLPLLIEAAETGVDIPKTMIPEFKKLKQTSEKYNNIVQKYSPETAVDNKIMAINQKIVRDTGVTYQAAGDKLAAYHKMSTPDLKLINDDLAQRVVLGRELYDEGRIFPVTHGLAEVEKVEGLIDPSRTIRNKRLSTREYGTSTYEDIAKSIQSYEFMIGLSKSQLEQSVKNTIKTEGRIGNMSLVADGSKDVKYISRANLDNKSLSDAMKSATKEATHADDIPVSTNVAQELAHQLDSNSGVFKGLAQDLYNTAKSVMLSQGTYLGANAITGAFNTAINSNVGIIDDILGAIATKGKLTENLGLQRVGIPQATAKNKALKGVQAVNKKTGGDIFAKLDKSLQNSLVEIASHAELRKAGIAKGDRIAATNDLTKANIGEMISDIKRVALINSPNTLLPKAANDLVSMTNPFWRWMDTATQSTVHMLEKSPVLSNVVIGDVLSNIGFDREMQNRLNMNVSLDTPYKSYKFDDRTGQIKASTVEFIPMMTTLKMIAPDKDNAFEPSIPFYTALVNASQGKDKYGNTIQRPTTDLDPNLYGSLNGQRYKIDEQGNKEKIAGMGDELLTTAIKELFGGANLLNRTIAPIASGVIGGLTDNPDAHYNQPYTNSILGDFNDYDNANNIIFGGDMDRQRTMGQVLNQISGEYEQKYYPNRGMTGSQLLNLHRNIAGEQSRRR